MIAKTPCQTGDPEHWFISRDGKQYAWDDLVSKADLLQGVMDAIDGRPLEDVTPEEVHIIRRGIVKTARDEQVKLRRQAKESCYSCPVRLQCLSVALEQGYDKGTWGGYFEEQLDKIRREMRKRQTVWPN